ncbi:MAG TPA: hypothetical protein VIO59_12650 [Rhodanobacter sp.]
MDGFGPQVGQGLRPAQLCQLFLIDGFVVVSGATQLRLPIAQAKQLVMAAINEPEELVIGVLALASTEVAAKATPRTTDNAMRFMNSSSHCAAMPR